MGLFNLFGPKEITTTQIDEIHYSELDRKRFLSNYFIPRKPLLIKEGAHGWPLIKDWSKDFISKNYGNYICTVISDSRPAHSNVKTTLKDYFINHKGKSTLTLDFDPLRSVFFKGIENSKYIFHEKRDTSFFFLSFCKRCRDTSSCA